MRLTPSATLSVCTTGTPIAASLPRTHSWRLALAEHRIEARPKAYRLLRDRETHRYAFKINRTSYLVDYRLEADLIVILRVWHGSQDRAE